MDGTERKWGLFALKFDVGVIRPLFATRAHTRTCEAGVMAFALRGVAAAAARARRTHCFH